MRIKSYFQKKLLLLIFLFTGWSAMAQFSLVKDINTTQHAASSDPQDFCVVGDFTFFRASNLLGDELWKSNGTKAGTVIVKNIYAGINNSNLSYLTNVNGTLFFTANDGTNGSELRKM